MLRRRLETDTVDAVAEDGAFSSMCMDRCESTSQCISSGVRDGVSGSVANDELGIVADRNHRASSDTGGRWCWSEHTRRARRVVQSSRRRLVERPPPPPHNTSERYYCCKGRDSPEVGQQTEVWVIIRMCDTIERRLGPRAPLPAAKCGEAGGGSYPGESKWRRWRDKLREA